MPNRERSSCIPCHATVRERATERWPSDRARVVAIHWASRPRTQRAAERGARFGAAVPAQTARERALFHAGNMQRTTDFSEQIAMAVATAIRATEISCLICRRSIGRAGVPAAYELCLVVGSASLYCTISKRACWAGRTVRCENHHRCKLRFSQAAERHPRRATDRSRTPGLAASAVPGNSATVVARGYRPA